jgi:hypothetical protein
MTSDYKKYSLEKLQEWVHDAMNSDASPHEIYSAIREAVREDYYYHKDCISRASGLLELLSGHRPVKDESVDDGMRPWGHSDLEYGLQYTDEEINAMCDAAEEQEKEKHSEHYYDYTRNDLNRKNPFLTYNQAVAAGWTMTDDGFWMPPQEKKKWVLPVEEVRDEDTDKDEYCITFPDDLLEAANLKENDIIEWVDQGDGSYLLKKHVERYRF